MIRRLPAAPPRSSTRTSGILPHRQSARRNGPEGAGRPNTICLNGGETFVLRGSVALSCKGAHVVLHAAEKHAKALGVPQCIALVDAAGDLLAFSRMDGARPGSIPIALAKARSAARRRRSTGEEGAATSDDADAAHHDAPGRPARTRRRRTSAGHARSI
ncbi:MAG: GlcG/HbpS family heme-binding protein [Vulcanimicrobiaceae bacterium]